MAEKMLQVDMLKQHNSDYIMYAVEVNRNRALPNSLDGLKTVHRRILWAMLKNLGMRKPNTQKVKTMKVMGEVVGNYHPHGDGSVKGSIKHMINDFEIYMPLIDGQGSFGSMYGDDQAAERYTSICLSAYSIECLLKDLIETTNVADFIPTYSMDDLEPKQIPVVVPNLLINGTSGIAVGMTTQVPKHNIVEVIDETLNVLHDPNHVVYLVPDNCTGSDIIKTDFAEICNTGKGKVTMRGKMKVCEFKTKNATFPALKVISMPDLVYFDTIKNQLEGLKDKIPQIRDIFNNTYTDDKTEKEVFEVFIVLEKECDPNYVKEMIYKSTSMEAVVPINMEVVLNGAPKLINYTEYIKSFIQMRMETKFRLYNYRYQNATTGYYAMELFIYAMKSGKMEEIQAIMRKNKTTSRQPVIDWLVKNLDVTPLQAGWLLDRGFDHISIGWLHEYEKKRDEYLAESKRCFEIATHPEAIKAEIEKELLDIKAKFGCPRRSRVISKAEASAVPSGTFRVIITQGGFIKKVNESEKTGSLGGDVAIFQIPIDNRDDVVMFTTSGRVFDLPVSKIPFAPKGNPGTALRSMITALTSDICCAVPKSVLKNMLKDRVKFYCYTISDMGYCKRMDIEDFIDLPKRGTIFSLLYEGDKIKSVLFMPEDYELLIYSRNKALRLNGTDISLLRRTTKGYCGMQSKFPIDGFDVLYPGATDLVVITESGRVNKVSISGVPVGKRAQAGGNIIKLGKTDKIKSVLVVGNKSILRIYDKNEKITELTPDQIPLGSTVSQGVKMTNGVSDAIKVDL